MPPQRSIVVATFNFESCNLKGGKRRMAVGNRMQSMAHLRRAPQKPSDPRRANLTL
jgi:hypothetical protein